MLCDYNHFPVRRPICFFQSIGKFFSVVCHLWISVSSTSIICAKIATTSSNMTTILGVQFDRLALQIQKKCYFFHLWCHKTQFKNPIKVVVAVFAIVVVIFVKNY